MDPDVNQKKPSVAPSGFFMGSLCGTFTTDGDLFTFVFTTQNSLSLIFTFGLQTLFCVLCCGLTMIDSYLSL